MKIISLNIGKLVEVDWQGQRIKTGIYKSPVETPRAVNSRGIEGDEVGDLKVHGGEHKAVYAYSAEDYEWWKTHFKGHEMGYGFLGENLTISDFDESSVCVGDEFLIGEGVVLQAIQPRQPCFKLGIKFGDQKIIKTFLDHGVFGVYFRVAKSGSLKVGDTLTKIYSHPSQIPVPSVFSILKGPSFKRETLQKLKDIETLCPKLKRKAMERLDAGL